MTYIISALIVVPLAPKVLYLPAEYAIGAVAAFIGAFVEALSGDIIDDNLSIPISIALVMWALYAVLLPSLNIFVLDGAG